MDMGAIMDAIADALITSVTKRAYSWPTESITAPCAVVGYPTTIDFDYTFDRGSDRLIFPVYFVAGKASDRNTRDELSSIVDGATGVKDALDGNLSGAVNTCTVTNGDITQITVGNIGYIAVEFTVEIIT